MSWGDFGMPLIWNDQVAEVVRLYDELKKLPRCEVGGPLHIITDDGNLEDHWLEPDPDRYKKHIFRNGRWEILDELYWPPEVINICERILELLRQMPEAWRYAVNAWHWGYAQKYLDNHPKLGRK